MEINEVENSKFLEKIPTSHKKNKVFKYQDKYLLKYIENKNSKKEAIEIYLQIQDKLTIPKILDYKIEEKTIVVLYEYISAQRQINSTNYDLALIGDLLSQFYQTTTNLEVSNNFKNYLKTLYLENIGFQERINSLLKTIDTKNQSIVLDDIHFRNFIMNSKKLYLIDLDNIMVAEKEYDLGKIFLLLIKNSQKIDKTFIEKFQKFLSKLNFNYSVSKIIDYAEVFLILKLVKYQNSQKSNKYRKYLKDFEFIEENKKYITEQIK